MIGVKARVQEPSGRWWTVQRVWWPRPQQTSVSSEAAEGGSGRFGGAGGLIGVVLDAVTILVWPLRLLVRVLVRGRWLIEAFPDENLGVEGAAWTVRGLADSRDAVQAIADGIRLGNSSPAPPGATPTRFRIKLRRAGLPLG